MLELSDIRVHREGRDILRLNQLELATDKVTVILGHNGSGKSTLMKLLARELQPDQGQLMLNRAPLSGFSQKALARQIAFLPQHLPSAAGLTVKDLVLLGRYPWRGLLGRWRAEDYKQVEAAMAQTDVCRYADQYADALSGGERQRAWVAMLLAQQAPLLLLDEPTSALDLAHQYELMELLCGLNRNTGRGVVVILHDLNLALRYADRVLVLKQGQLAFSGSPQQLSCATTLTELFDIDLHLCPHPTADQAVAVVA